MIACCHLFTSIRPSPLPLFTPPYPFLPFHPSVPHLLPLPPHPTHSTHTHPPQLCVREDGQGEVVVADLTEVPVQDAAALEAVIDAGTADSRQQTADSSQ